MQNDYEKYDYFVGMDQVNVRNMQRIFGGDKDGKISVLVAHSLSRLRILTLFPSIFKGKHIKYTKYIDLLKCDSISVEYDTPCALQMDGEPMLEITGYSATIKSKEKVLV